MEKNADKIIYDTSDSKNHLFYKIDGTDINQQMVVSFSPISKRLILAFAEENNPHRVALRYELDEQNAFQLERFELIRDNVDSYYSNIFLIDKWNDVDVPDLQKLEKAYGTYECHFALDTIDKFYNSPVYNVAINKINKDKLYGNKVHLSRDEYETFIKTEAEKSVELTRGQGYIGSTYPMNGYLMDFLPLENHPRLSVIEYGTHTEAYYHQEHQPHKYSIKTHAELSIQKSEKGSPSAIWGDFGKIAHVLSYTYINETPDFRYAEQLLKDPRLEKYFLDKPSQQKQIEGLYGELQEIKVLPADELDRKYHPLRDHNRAALTISPEEEARIRALSPEALFDENKAIFAAGKEGVYLSDFFNKQYGDEDCHPATWDGSQSESTVGALVKKMASENNAWVNMKSHPMIPILVKSGLAIENGDECTISASGFLRYKKWMGFHKKI